MFCFFLLLFFWGGGGKASEGSLCFANPSWGRAGVFCLHPSFKPTLVRKCFLGDPQNARSSWLPLKNNTRNAPPSRKKPNTHADTNGCTLESPTPADPPFGSPRSPSLPGAWLRAPRAPGCRWGRRPSAEPPWSSPRSARWRGGSAGRCPPL